MDAESVRRHHVAARFIVGLLDRRNCLRMGQVPAFRRLARLQALRLQQRAHAAVQEERPSVQQLLQTHFASLSFIPMIAVTLLLGVMSRLSVSVIPRICPQSSASMTFRCSASGRSP